MKIDGYQVTNEILESKQIVHERFIFNDKITILEEELSALVSILPKIEKAKKQYIEKVKKSTTENGLIDKLAEVVFEISINFDSALRSKIKRGAAAKGMMTVILLDGNAVLAIKTKKNKDLSAGTADFIIEEWKVPINYVV